ncbi:MAG TPA: hypothetical protein PKH02_10910 [Bacteroidales bacterium]|nr:hypothetical protein [Bacteroidales bacterium]HPT12282.1 hypothetical protein [Bacteroidales bacterium]
METRNEPEQECCPPFNPEPWEDKLFEWSERKFIKARVFTFFYMPVNFGPVMKKLNEMLVSADAEVVDWMCLSDHTSRWNMDIYLAVDREVPGVTNTTLSGKYYSKVYEGPFKDTGKWCKDYSQAVQSMGMKVKKWLMWYTTCPKCAKKYGKNYVVIVSRVETT